MSRDMLRLLLTDIFADKSLFFMKFTAKNNFSSPIITKVNRMILGNEEQFIREILKVHQYNKYKSKLKEFNNLKD
jgi:hypothetical protein